MGRGFAKFDALGDDDPVRFRTGEDEGIGVVPEGRLIEAAASDSPYTKDQWSLVLYPGAVIASVTPVEQIMEHAQPIAVKIGQVARARTQGYRPAPGAAAR